MTVTWEAIGAGLAVITAIIGAATAYLRIYIGKVMSDLRLELARGYVSKQELEREIARLRDGGI